MVAHHIGLHRRRGKLHGQHSGPRSGHRRPWVVALHSGRKGSSDPHNGHKRRIGPAVERLADQAPAAIDRTVHPKRPIDPAAVLGHLRSPIDPAAETTDQERGRVNFRTDLAVVQTRQESQTGLVVVQELAVTARAVA